MSSPGDEKGSRAAAMASPTEGFFRLEQDRCDPGLQADATACYGFSVVAKVSPGNEESVRAFGRTIEQAVECDPALLAPLALHYLRWLLFDVGSGLHFMYQGIFDADIDKPAGDALAAFVRSGIAIVFRHLEGWPDDWRTNPAAVAEFFRAHHCPSLLEYGEYPVVTADEIRTALSRPPGLMH
jgi:hypothetical protein